MKITVGYPRRGEGPQFQLPHRSRRGQVSIVVLPLGNRSSARSKMSKENYGQYVLPIVREIQAHDNKIQCLSYNLPTFVVRLH